MSQFQLDSLCHANANAHVKLRKKNTQATDASNKSISLFNTHVYRPFTKAFKFYLDNCKLNRFSTVFSINNKKLLLYHLLAYVIENR